MWRVESHALAVANTEAPPYTRDTRVSHLADRVLITALIHIVVLLPCHGSYMMQCSLTPMWREAVLAALPLVLHCCRVPNPDRREESHVGGLE